MAPSDRPGAVIAMRLSMLAAECADPERFSRGKRYAKDGAVVACDVARGEVVGQVQGSERAPYDVVIRWRPSSFRPGVVPTRDELVLRCSCLDMTPVCKHAVALLVHLAELVAVTPAVLYEWRGPDDAWEHLPVRPALHVVPSGPDRAPTGGPQRPAPVPAGPPEPDPLDPFFGTRDTMWGEGQDDPLDPFPEIVPLTAGPRPPDATPVGMAAAALLDEVMDALTSLFG